MLGIEKKITKEMYAKEIIKAVKGLTLKETKRVVCEAVQDVADYSFEKAWNFASDIACHCSEEVAKRTKKDVLIEVLALIKSRLAEEGHEADSMTGDEVIAKVMDVYNSNKAIIEAAKVEESKTFEVMEQKVEMMDDIHEIVSIRFNPYVTEEKNAAWKINNSYTARGYEHKNTLGHKDGYSHIMLLGKIKKKADAYETIHVWDNGNYYPVEAIVMKLTDHTITFKTKRGKLVTESLHKIKGGKN